MSVLAAAAVGVVTFTGAISDKDPLIQNIHSRVMETIKNSDNVPGLKSEEFSSLKSGIVERWNELVQNGVLEITATDKEVRPYFVALQAIIEHVLANELNKSVKSLTGVIHTPMPATPLCTEGHVSNELVHPTVNEDPLRLSTVKARTTIIRDYLLKGGNLFIVYPKDGIKQRSESQLKVYRQELKNYPSNLFDRPLDCISIDTEVIGAFYLFKNSDGKVFGFAIKMTQANSPQDLGNFGLWLGEVKNSPVHQRILNVLEAIQKYFLEPIELPI